MNYTRINQLIGKALLYYSDGLYRLSDTGFDKIEQGESSHLNKLSHINKLSRVLVVARHHYIERTISLPITIKQDVKAAIEFEIEGLQQEFQLFYKVVHQSEGKTRVAIWQVPKAIIPKGIALVIPESYLLAGLLAPNQILRYLSTDGRPVLLTNTLTHLFSSASANQTLPIFTQAAGVSISEPLEFSSDDLAKQLIQGVFSRGQALFTGFWCRSERVKRDWQALLKPLLLPAIVCASVYLALSTAYVSFQYNRAESKIDEQADSINAVLRLQSQIAQRTQELAQFENINEVQPPLWRVWQIFAPFYAQEVTVKFIRYNNEQVYFSAEAESASNILESMLDNPMVLDPEFTTAVKKQRNDKESFIIRFSLAPYDASQDEHTSETIATQNTANSVTDNMKQAAQESSGSGAKEQVL
ncbi:hypothetical protein [Shewanella sp. UCD-KL12]|uniref:hypothetical protein n=1 Tax=Shewanella sp. UCD-KL12 TaxID=1917163 RepID=UPI00097146BF|nr:hypothetical protein [Shewanella sp. UCD-KL12]